MGDRGYSPASKILAGGGGWGSAIMGGGTLGA